jgi:hypothetical protein
MKTTFRSHQMVSVSHGRFRRWSVFWRVTRTGGGGDRCSQAEETERTVAQYHR